MAPTVTGTPVQINDSVNNAGSQAITVPSDCTGVILSVGGWTSSEVMSLQSGATYTLGGAAFTQIEAARQPGNHQQYVGWLPSPSTGSQTFAWDLAGASAQTEGTIFYFVFITGNNVSPNLGAIRDVKKVEAAGTTTYDLPSLTAVYSDLVVVIASMFLGVGGQTHTWSQGVTSLANMTEFSGTCGGVATGTSSGSLTPRDVEGIGTDGSLIGFSIKQTASLPLPNYTNYPKAKLRR